MSTCRRLGALEWGVSGDRRRPAGLRSTRAVHRDRFGSWGNGRRSCWWWAWHGDWSGNWGHARRRRRRRRETQQLTDTASHPNRARRCLGTMSGRRCRPDRCSRLRRQVVEQRNSGRPITQNPCGDWDPRLSATAVRWGHAHAGVAPPVEASMRIRVRGVPASAGEFSGVAHTLEVRNPRNASASPIVANSRSTTT